MQDSGLSPKMCQALNLLYILAICKIDGMLKLVESPSSQLASKKVVRDIIKHCGEVTEFETTQTLYAVILEELIARRRGFASRITSLEKNSKTTELQCRTNPVAGILTIPSSLLVSITYILFSFVSAPHIPSIP